MGLNSREQQILNLIYNSEVPIHANDISQQLNISIRSVQYDVKKINQYLNINNIGEIKSEYGIGYFVDHDQKDHLSKVIKLDAQTSVNYYQFLPHERVNIMIAYITSKMVVDNLEVFEEICMVSRNTVISDLKLVTEVLSEYNIELEFKKNRGYYITSNPIQARSIFLFYFNQIRYLYKKDVLNFLEKDLINAYLHILEKIEKSLNTVYVEGVLESLAALLSLIPITEFDKNLFIDINIEQVKQKKEYKLVDEYFYDFSEFEKIYISFHLLGGRVQPSNEIINIDMEDQQLYDLCRYMVFDFESIACVKFDDSNEIVQSLFVHLRSSIYRYRYGIDIGNPLTDTIKKKYKYLFEITKLVSEDIRRFFGMPANENEIAYLTVIFGSKMEKSRYTREQTLINVACFESSGIREMLKNELKYIIDDAKIIFLDNLEDIKRLSSDSILLSIHPLEIEIDYTLISPVLTTIDKQNIMNRIFKLSTRTNHNMLMESIYDMIKKYVDPVSKEEIYDNLENIFDKYNMVDYSLEQHNPSLVEILKEEHIQFFEDEYIWNEALQISAKPLLKGGYISQNYVDTILSSVIQKGPYMYFGKGVFIAHATPKDGVNKLGVSLSFFDKPVVFGQDKNVKIIIYLSPIDYHKHLRIIKEILELFDVNESFDDFVKLSNSEEILNEVKFKLRKKE